MNPLPHRILALGEVTGHCHEASEGATLYETATDDISVKALNEWRVSHQEHHVVECPVHEYTGTKTANYTRRIVKEYDHAAEAARAVAD